MAFRRKRKGKGRYSKRRNASRRSKRITRYRTSRGGVRL